MEYITIVSAINTENPNVRMEMMFKDTCPSHSFKEKMLDFAETLGFKKMPDKQKGFHLNEPPITLTNAEGKMVCITERTEKVY